MKTLEDTRVLLSSVVTLPLLEKAFQWARDFKFHGLELMPYRWTGVERVQYLSTIYGVPVTGIHLPFWWKTKPLRRVIQSEIDPKEKVFALIWWLIFGPGHSECPAVKLLHHFLDAYVNIHPDTYHQVPDTRLIHGRDVYVENERPKRGEGEDTFNPFLICPYFLSSSRFFRGRLMFDPGHIQIAQEEGKFPHRSIANLYLQLRPAGLHLSFSGEGRLHDLPSKKEWEELVELIRDWPPRYIVVETKPGPGARERVARAREMLEDDLGI